MTALCCCKCSISFNAVRFPIIDNDILPNDLEGLIREGPLRNVDILIGVTADEALYFAEEHIFNYYLPKKDSKTTFSTTTQRPSVVKSNGFATTTNTMKKATGTEQLQGFSYFLKNNYIENYLKTNYPDHLCYYENVQARFMPHIDYQNNLNETARLYTNLVR